MNHRMRGGGGRNMRRILVALAAFAVLAAACGDDDDSDSTTATTTGGDTATTSGAKIDVAAFDANGDGKIRIGIAAAGPRDDGGYYQAVVDAATKFSKDNGFEDPIVVDNIQAADAATELENLAQQPIDVM